MLYPAELYGHLEILGLRLQLNNHFSPKSGCYHKLLGGARYIHLTRETMIENKCILSYLHKKCFCDFQYIKKKTLSMDSKLRVFDII